MATKIERAQSIGNALVNRTVTNAELVRIGNAIISNQMRNPADFTAAQKAEEFLKFGRDAYLSQVKQYEGQLSASNAAASTYQAIQNDFIESS